MEICPYLGKSDDPDTPILYPSAYNDCYRAKTVRTPALFFQEATCLTSAYQQCPLFLNPAQFKAVPALESQFSRRTIRRPVFFWLVILILAIAIGAAGYLLWKNQLLPFWSPAVVATVQTAAPVSPTLPVASRTPEAPAVVPTLAPTLTPTPTERHSSTPSPEPTATLPPISMIELETPFGTDERFVIHRVKAGDSLNELSAKYNMTIDAIKWVNYTLPIPLVPDRLVIIPINSLSTDSKTPQFEAYQVTADDMTWEDLASRSGADLAQLLYYNGAQSGQLFAGGYWLLIPHPR